MSESIPRTLQKNVIVPAFRDRDFFDFKVPGLDACIQIRQSMLSPSRDTRRDQVKYVRCCSTALSSFLRACWLVFVGVLWRLWGKRDGAEIRGGGKTDIYLLHIERDRAARETL